MKTVQELFDMDSVMKDAILNKKPSFVYNGETFTRESWLDDVYENDGVRICLECGELMTEGYLVAGSDTYCSLDCCDDAEIDTTEIRDAIKNDLDYDDDNFFWTMWEED